MVGVNKWHKALSSFHEYDYNIPTWLLVAGGLLENELG